MFNQNAEEAETQRALHIFKLLTEHYPQAETALKFADPFQLFVATVLSAQTTDEQVNRITAVLFPRAGSPRKIAQMKQHELEQYLKGCGLFRQKSRFLIEASRKILEKHGGRIPNSFEELVALPGAGRKTANVVLYNAFGHPAFAVDTHVYRVSRRLGLAAGKKVEQVEEELKAILPPAEWGAAHHRLITHGRRVCKARRPRCSECMLHQHCPSKLEYTNRDSEESSNGLGKA
jgi:endonuclease III